jgi:Uma2 family endonuclease
MDVLVEQLRHSPKLDLYFQEIQKILREDQRNRERFYDMITPNDKAEFINGEIIFHSPVRLQHNVVGKFLLTLLDTYVRKHKLGYVGYEKLLITLSRNDYEPDLCFFSDANAQQFSPQQTRFPAPDFIVEILSQTTEDNDRGVKFEDYAAHSVNEYWIIDPDAEIVEQYVLAGDEYELVKKTDSGVLKSATIPGFEIPVRAVFDERENFETLQCIIG